VSISLQPIREVFSPQERALLVAPILLLLCCLLGWAYQSRPYQDQIAHFATSLAGRSQAQRQNITQAAQRLNGTVVGPGERCSFNAVVGPRTPERGFREANAFMEGRRTRSIGGGVCQVSSTLYAALQETTLPIVKRVPHYAAIGSIQPGRDATVWYGQADLVWENKLAHPVRIKAHLDNLQLHVELWGTAEEDLRAALRFSNRYGRRSGERMVAVYRRVGGKNILLSRDTYRVR
jgi:vancomycin resistance protein YoaR